MPTPPKPETIEDQTAQTVNPATPLFGPLRKFLARHNADEIEWDAIDKIEGWVTMAIQALKGAEVLALCLADAKATLADSDQYGILKPEEAEAIKGRFLGNNDNVLAVRDALRAWPNAPTVPTAD